MTKTFLRFVLFFFVNGIICVTEAKFLSVGADATFFVSTDSKNFIGAYLECTASDMELASVANSDEEIALNKTFDLQKSTVGYWIGGVDEFPGANKWYWINSHFKMAYTNWGSTQPNFKESKKQCVRVGNFYKVNETDRWANVDCSLELPYVCKQTT